MGRHGSTVARHVAVLGMAAAALAPATATADTVAEVRITVGPQPGVSVTPSSGAVDLVGTVRGVLDGEPLDLTDCSVRQDLAGLATGAGSVTLAGCDGSDAVVTVDPRGGGSGSLKIETRRYTYIGTWCEWQYPYGIPVWTCWFRVDLAS